MAGPLHLKAAEFRRLGLFSGIECFSELERRMEALANEQQKGDAFEVFAEAYLATQSVVMAKHVWPDKVISSSIRKRLRLSARDVGADGVIETVSGKHRAYQVKFRSGRASLTWSDTATFFGVTDHCDDRRHPGSAVCGTGSGRIVGRRRRAGRVRGNLGRVAGPARTGRSARRHHPPDAGGASADHRFFQRFPAARTSRASRPHFLSQRGRYKRRIDPDVGSS